MRISIEGWKEAGRDLPNTVGKTSLFTKAIIEKYGQGDNYVFDPAMLVYLVKAEPQPEEEKKSPSEERAKEYVIREKEVLKLVTQQEKSKEFLTRIMKTSTIPGGRELLKRKSFRQQFAIWIQTFIKEYQEYVQNTLLNTSVMNDAKTEILNELTALTKTLELWNHATSMKESSYQNEIEKKVQEIRQKREKLEKQEYLQKVQRMFIQEMEKIDTKRFLEEEEKKLPKFQAVGSNVRKYLEKVQSVYLEEILLKTLERKEITSTFEESYLPQNRILTLEEWERENILSVEESVVQGEQTERELHHLVRNRMMEMSEEERQALYRELVYIKKIREEQRELYAKQVSRIMSRKEEEKALQELQTIRDKEQEHRRSVQATCLKSTEIKERITESLEEELFKTLVKRKKETRSEEKNLSQSRILTLEEWKREIFHRAEEDVVQEEKTNHELRYLVRNSLTELSEEERKELYQELVDRKEARREWRELYEKQSNKIVNQKEEEILKKRKSVYLEEVLLKTLERKKDISTSEEVRLSQNRILTFDEWEREIFHRAEEDVVQEEKTNHELHYLVRNSLTELSEEERKELYQELVDRKEARRERRELYEKQSNKIVNQKEEEIPKKRKSAYLEEVFLKTLEQKRKISTSEEVKLSQNRFLLFDDWEREIFHRAEENVVQGEKIERTEKIEQELHHLVRNSLMEMSEEERQDFYKKLITAEKAEEIEQVISHRIGMTQAQEQTLIRELQTVFLEEVRKEEILVEMPEIQRNYMQTLLQFRNQEYAQTSNLERELIQNEENQTVQSEKDSIERFYYNRSQVENIEKIRMEQREQFLNLQEISRQQGEQLEKMEIQQKELKEKLERAKQNPYEQEQKVMQKLENQLRLEQLRRGLA